MIALTEELKIVRLSEREIIHLIDILEPLTHTVRQGEHVEQEIEHAILGELRRQARAKRAEYHR